jgi:hypothetical protein
LSLLGQTRSRNLHDIYGFFRFDIEHNLVQTCLIYSCDRIQSQQHTCDKDDIILIKYEEWRSQNEVAA